MIRLAPSSSEDLTPIKYVAGTRQSIKVLVQACTTSGKYFTSQPCQLQICIRTDELSFTSHILSLPILSRHTSDSCLYGLIFCIISSTRCRRYVAFFPSFISHDRDSMFMYTPYDNHRCLLGNILGHFFQAWDIPTCSPQHLLEYFQPASWWAFVSFLRVFFHRSMILHVFPPYRFLWYPRSPRTVSPWDGMFFGNMSPGWDSQARHRRTASKVCCWQIITLISGTHGHFRADCVRGCSFGSPVRATYFSHFRTTGMNCSPTL